MEQKQNKNSEWHKKSYEERYGKDKAKEVKDKIRNTMSNRILTNEHKRKIGVSNKGKLLNKSYEEIHGEEKSIEIKNKISNNNWPKKMKGNFPKNTIEKKRNNMLGENNPMFGIIGPDHPSYKGGDNASSRRSYKQNINFRLKKLIRTRIRQVLNRQLNGGKTNHSSYYGIDVDKIVTYLTKQLPDDFTSKDYDIHHIKDLAEFDLNNPKEIIKAFDPRNHIIISREEHNKHHHPSLNY